MGLMQNLAMMAIRNKVVKTLRENCPADLKGALEQLLGDNKAVAAIQNLVAANLKTPAGITPEAIRSLPVDAATADLLAGNEALVGYLVETAIAGITRLG